MNELNMKILYRMKYGLFSAIWLLLLAANDVSGQIQLSFTTEQPSCNGYTNGTATVTATGGNTPYTYLWNNGQGGQTNFGLGAGTVFVTVTDQNGQSATGSVAVTQPDPLTVTFSTTGLSCSSANGTLTANPAGGIQPYTYIWSTTATTQTIPISVAGTYFVTVTDVNGCSKVAAYNVSPVADFFPSYTYTMPLCHGQSNGSIGITIFGTNPAFTWEWSNGTVNQSLTNIPAGDYGITITDSKGCTYTDTVTLMDQPQLIVEVMVTNIPCNNLPNGGAVYAAVAGGVSPYTYVWDNNGSNLSGQQNLPAGTYTVTVTDKNGCTASDSGTILIPPPLTGEVAALSPACGGNNGCITVQGVGGTPPYTYSWPVLGVNGPKVCDLAPGDYYVCIFDANGCQHDMIVTMTAIAGLDVTLVLTKAECPGVDNGTATAIVNPPTGTYQYQWIPQPNPSVSQINGIPAGTSVSVTVTDMNTGCVGTATGAIGAHNVVKVTVTDTDVTCVGDLTGSAVAVASGGTNPYDYVWTLPGSTVSGPTVSNLGVGAYAVSVTDAKGCTAVGVADIGALSNPKAAYELVVLECVGDEITVQFTDKSTDQTDTIVSWNWNITWSTGNTTSTQQNPPILELPENETGTVQLTVTSAQGCTAVVSAPFQVFAVPTVSVSVPNPAVDCDNGPIPIVVTGAAGNTYTWSPLTGLTFNPDAQNVIANPTGTMDYQLIVNNGQCADTVSVQVIRVEPINLTVQDDNVVTCDTVATLTAAANAAAGVSFVWLDSSGDTIGTTPVITVQANGQNTYSVIAMDAYGCSETDTATVTGNSVNVDASFSGTVTDCADAPVSLSVTNLDPADILTYQWSSSSPNLIITPQGASAVTATGPAGTYTVTVVVQNQFDCERTFTTQLTLQPSTSLDGDILIDLCKGKIVGFQNNSNISGTWDFGDNTTSIEDDPTHTYAQEGTYTVTFSSTENCVFPFDTVIMVLPDAAVQAAIANNYEACSDQAVIQFADQTVHFYDIATWNWSFSTTPPQTSNQQNPLITFTQEGTITATLTVTDVNGCTGTATAPVQITVVSDTLSSQAVLCPGETVALNPDFNPSYIYQWVSQPNDPNFDANSPNPTVMPTVQTVYMATIVNGPCTVTDSVTVMPQPAATVELPTDSLVVCSDDVMTVKVLNTNGVTFVWSESPTFNPPLPASGDSVLITPEKNGVYYVMALNAAGCSAIDSIHINNGAVDLDADPTNRSICLGESTVLTITNLDPDDVLTYQWTPALDPIPNPAVTPNTTTTYTVQTSNQFGCADTVQFDVNVITIDVTAEVTGKDTICPGQSTELLATVTSNSSNITYNWTPSNSLTSADTATPTAAPTENTVYTVTATAEGLCPDTASVTVFFMTGECAEPYIFVPKAFTPNNDGNNEFFIVRGLDIAEVYFVVWDRWGEKVYETEDPKAQGWDGTFNGKELTPDSYAWYVRVTCGNGEIYTSKGDVALLK